MSTSTSKVAIPESQVLGIARAARYSFSDCARRLIWVPGVAQERSPLVVACSPLFPIAVKFAVYPIDRGRMLMQTQWAPGVEQRNLRLSGVWQSLREACKTEGYLSPWRGFATTCFRWGPYQCLNLAAKDFLASRLQAVRPYSREQQFSQYFASKFLVGATAGIASAALWGYPLDVIRQHLATHNAAQRASAIGVTRNVWRTQGMLGFYRGFGGGCAGLAIFRGVQLGGWDIVKEWYGKEEWRRQTSLSHFLHAQAISIVGSLCSYPVDTVCRNVVRSASGISYSACIASGTKRGGGYLCFLYTGFSARIASSFVNGAILECWDITKS